MERKMVRPCMTTEARDVLDKIHENVNGETRSESIEWFWIRYNNLLIQRDGLQSELKAVKAANESKERRLKMDLSSLSSNLLLIHKKNQEWKVYCAVLACTTIASLVALAIQAA